jgi:hypothetical protein
MTAKKDCYDYKKHNITFACWLRYALLPIKIASDISCILLLPRLFLFTRMIKMMDKTKDMIAPRKGRYLKICKALKITSYFLIT